MPEQQVEKIHQLLEHFSTAMLITHSPGHPLHARPMAVAKLEPNCGLWFFTGRDSRKVHDIEEDQGVLIVCQDEHASYVSLAGRANLVSDREKFREFWKETYRVWFPQGVDDPNLLLIFVQPEQAEYWDSRGAQGLNYFFESAKAYATGRTPEIKEGEQHGTTVFHEI